jgi:hypothetical protein
MIVAYSSFLVGYVRFLIHFILSVLRIRDVLSRSRIQQKKKEEGNKISTGSYLTVPFFVAIHFTKLKVIYFFEQVQKRYEPSDKELKYFEPQKLLLRSPNVWVGPVMRIKTDPRSGSGNQISTESWIQTRYTASFSPH